MTTAEALHRVYAAGKVCEGCQWHFHTLEVERLPGRATEMHGVRGCSIIDSHRGRDPFECPGVEDELAKAEGE